MLTFIRLTARLSQTKDMRVDILERDGHYRKESGVTVERKVIDLLEVQVTVGNRGIESTQKEYSRV